MTRWHSLALVLLAAVAVSGLVARHSRAALGAAGVPAPRLELDDTEGRVVSLDHLRGRVVALNFWASWCPSWQQEIPDLAKVYAQHRSTCFELLGVAEESGG